LLHHGSGPRYTSLIDPEFPAKLARFAAAVAQRYPWIDMYTPVNEPLTTARFGALYGHWYPHATDEQTFTTALLNEIRGTIFAMRAIRWINPRAQLVQTEDLGRTFSTPQLRDQAQFENERRWITWDLLAGRVRPGTRMWHHLLWAGLRPNDLEFFLSEPCAADFIGINYYVTSERYLDHKIDMYPPELHGGNGRERYADDAAVRAREEGLAGAQLAITEAFDRYRTPIALTEVHLGCTIDEQLRWADEMWNAAQAARDLGADVRAVTAWALLGSFDWDSLVTRRRNHYEPGAFNLSLGQTQLTELGAFWSARARAEEFHHPALNTPGWWRRPERLRFAALATAA
jgi:dTDP-4-dehydrorhamnose reductase